MELLVYLEGSTIPDRYRDDERYETDLDTQELVILPAAKYASEVAITTYAAGKWIKVQRVRDHGEVWPAEIVAPGDPDDNDEENVTSIRHLVQGNPYGDSTTDN